MAGERCSAGGCFWQCQGSPASSRRSLEARSDKSGRRSRSDACVCTSARHGPSRISGARPKQTFSAAHPDAVSLTSNDSGAIGAKQAESDGGHQGVAKRCFDRVGTNYVCRQYLLPLCGVIAGSGISVSRKRHSCRLRVSEDSRPQRDRLELLDGSVGASGRGPCKRFASENFAGRGCRSCPR
jgi:hypothetical protein